MKFMHVATQNRIRTTFHRSASLLAIEHTAEIINLGHTMWNAEIKMEYAPRYFIGTYHDEFTDAENKVEGMICAPVLVKQDVAPTVQGGLANTSNTNGLCQPGVLIAGPNIEPDVVQQQIQNRTI